MPEQDQAFEVGKLPHTRGDEFVFVYTNAANVIVSFFDLAIVFSQATPTPDGRAVVQEKAMVSMSLEHAKALLNALRKPIEDYEKDNGPIRTPSGLPRVEVTTHPKEQPGQS